MAVAKVIEISSSSGVSFEDAIVQGIAKASESVRDITAPTSTSNGFAVAGDQRARRDDRGTRRLAQDCRRDSAEQNPAERAVASGPDQEKVRALRGRQDHGLRIEVNDHLAGRIDFVRDRREGAIEGVLHPAALALGPFLRHHEACGRLAIGTAPAVGTAVRAA